MRFNYSRTIMLLTILILSGCEISSQEPSSTPITEKSTQTYTPQPSQTITTTPSITPKPTINGNSAHIVIENLPGGNWLYTDYDSGIEFSIGEKWYLEDVSKLDTVEIFERVTVLKTELNFSEVPVVLVEPRGMTAFGLYMDGSIPDHLSTLLTVSHIKDSGFVDLSLEEILELAIQVYSDSHSLDPESIQSRIFNNPNGFEFGAIIYNHVLNYYQMRIFYKLHDGIGMIVFGYSEINIDIMGNDISLVTDTLQYIEKQY